MNRKELAMQRLPVWSSTAALSKPFWCKLRHTAGTANPGDHDSESSAFGVWSLEFPDAVLRSATRPQKAIHKPEA
jgi:hypothetical protein